MPVVKRTLLMALLGCVTCAAAQQPLSPDLARRLGQIQPALLQHIDMKGVRVLADCDARERALDIARTASDIHEWLAAELKLTPRISPPIATVLLGLSPQLQAPQLAPRAAFIPDELAILLAADANPREIRHELVHLALARLCDKTPLSLWLEEALAESLSAQPEGAAPGTHLGLPATTRDAARRLEARCQTLDLLEILDATAATHTDWLSRDAAKATAFMAGSSALLEWIATVKPGSSAAAQRDPLRALIALETGRRALHGRSALAHLVGDSPDLAATRAAFRVWNAQGAEAPKPVPEKTRGRVP